MKIIVTGGSGFLGTHLIQALITAHHEVINIDLKKSSEHETIIGDVRDANLMKQLIRDADLVFHLAALIEAGESVKFPQKFIETNILGTLNVLTAMKENGLKIFIFSSTAAIYGEPLKVPIQEDDRTIPINPYGMTKLAIEGLLSSYVSSFGFTGVALRYFNLYGPKEHHEPETHAIPRFIKQIQNNEEVTIWGNGEHERDYIYIEDIVDAHLKAIEWTQTHPGQYGYFNLSTEKATKVIDLVRIIEKIMNKKASIKHFLARPGDSMKLVADALKAKNELGWQAKIKIEEGLQKTVEYFTKKSF